MLNRAVTGLYPPGSTFKPVVAMAALRTGVPPTFATDCSGAFEIGPLRLRCAARYGHGRGITMRKALEVSCNPFFCEVGVRTGPDAITSLAREAGLGARTGIDLPGEAAGLVPDDAWKRRTGRGGWSRGDTANLSIGQGYLLATPLQMALCAAMIASGGTLWRPRLCLDAPPVAVRQLSIPRRHLDLVRGGMFDVVNAPKGGGRRARVNGVSVAAKTGTAEYGPARNRRKHAWMIAFAPFEEPEIALAAVIEDGESGGTTAAPVVAAVLAEYFGTTPVPEEEEESSRAELRDPGEDAGVQNQEEASRAELRDPGEDARVQDQEEVEP
jgi:penicillin-binding protein 2